MTEITHPPITTVRVFSKTQLETIEFEVKDGNTYISGEFKLNFERTYTREKGKTTERNWYEYSIPKKSWDRFAPKGLKNSYSIQTNVPKIYQHLYAKHCTFFEPDDKYGYFGKDNDSFTSGYSVHEGSPFFANFLTQK